MFKEEWCSVKAQVQRLVEYEEILIESFERATIPEQRQIQNFLNRIYELKRKAEEIERLEY